MSKHENISSLVQPASFESAAIVVDDWENIEGDQVQQLTNERLHLVEQQKHTNAVEQQLANEPADVEDVGLPARSVILLSGPFYTSL